MPAAVRYSERDPVRISSYAEGLTLIGHHDNVKQLVEELHVGTVDHDKMPAYTGGDRPTQLNVWHASDLATREDLAQELRIAAERAGVDLVIEATS